MSAPPVVFHLIWQYLGYTETFIYTALRSLTRSKPVVISYGKVINQDKFPTGSAPLYSLHERFNTTRGLPWRALHKLTRGRSFPAAVRRECEIIARQQHPRLLHAHFGHTGYCALRLRQALDVPLITTFYGRDTTPTPLEPKWQSQRRELFEKGDLFLVEGPHMRNTLLSLGCPEKRVHIQPIGIDLAITPFRGARTPGRVPVVLFAARFVEKKGIEYGLEAVSQLCAAGYRMECRVIGAGPLEQRLRELVAERRADTAVRFLGAVDHSRFLQELNDADIFVQPSVTATDGDCEGGAPTTILEAQACGVPVVATLHADIPNVVAPGQIALLVGERDSTGLAKALGTLLDRPQDWDEIGRIGRSFVETHHCAGRAADHLEDLYFRLLGRKS